MRRLQYLPTASQNLSDIYTYLARESRSRDIAQMFINRLRQQCENLASLPGTLGRARPELHPEIRSFATGNYVILLVYRKDALVIVNIIEGHRDFQPYADL